MFVAKASNHATGVWDAEEKDGIINNQFIFI